MVETRNNSLESKLNINQDHTKFVQELKPHEIMAILLRDSLYEGSWDDYESDLLDRKLGRPYIFKIGLSHEVNSYIDAIKKLRNYEERHNINIADYLNNHNNKKESSKKKGY